MNRWILRTEFHKETGDDAEIQNEQAIGTTDNDSIFPFNCKYVRWLEEYIINKY